MVQLEEMQGFLAELLFAFQIARGHFYSQVLNDGHSVIDPGFQA